MNVIAEFVNDDRVLHHSCTQEAKREGEEARTAQPEVNMRHINDLECLGTLALMNFNFTDFHSYPSFFGNKSRITLSQAR